MAWYVADPSATPPVDCELRVRRHLYEAQDGRKPSLCPRHDRMRPEERGMHDHAAVVEPSISTNSQDWVSDARSSCGTTLRRPRPLPEPTSSTLPAGHARIGSPGADDQ